MSDEEEVDQEAMMAEWEAMAGDGGDGEGGAAAAAADAFDPTDGGEDDEADERVLNQDEIDMLLGFEAGDEEEQKSGIQAILDKSLMAYERLPMIEVVFDRLVRMLSSSLRNYTAENIDVTIDSMVSQRFDDYMNSIPLPAMLAVFRAVEWENFGLVTVDSSMIYSLVDVLFGGRRLSKPIRIEGRPYTTIEQDIVKEMIEIILHDLSTAFDPLSPVTFQFDRIESNPRFATITRPNNAVLLVRLRVDMEDRGGMVEICVPHTTLEPIRDLLLQMFMGEKFGHDAIWERNLGREVQQTDIEIEVVMERRKMTLGEIVGLEVGKTIMLDRKANDDVSVVSGGVELAKARLGRKGDNIAVMLEEEIGEKAKELT